jgi:hypothetical protein
MDHLMCARALPFARNRHIRALSHNAARGSGVARLGSTAMIWFFENSGKYRRCELHPLRQNHYRLIIHDVDGSEKVESYEQYDDLLRRTEQLATEWTRTGWSGPFSRR